MRDARIVTVTLNPAVDRVIEAPGFKVGARVTGHVVAWYPTGRGITVSRVLATLGLRSIATGFVGARELGMFEEHLQRVGGGRIVTQLLIVRARTRDNISVVDPVNDTETHVRDGDFTVQPEDVRRLTSKLAMLAREGAIMVFAGSAPSGVEPEALRAMVERSNAAGAKVVINMNDEALAALAGLRFWTLKINCRQLASLTGGDTSSLAGVVEAGRSLIASRGGPAECVVVTRGADGAVLLTDREELTGLVGVHPGRIISTVGSGECLVGGLTAGWLRTGDWGKALHEGLAAATANAVDREAGQINLDDVVEFREAGVVEPAAAALGGGGRASRSGQEPV